MEITLDIVYSWNEVSAESLSSQLIKIDKAVTKSNKLMSDDQTS